MLNALAKEEVHGHEWAALMLETAIPSRRPAACGRQAGPDAAQQQRQLD